MIGVLAAAGAGAWFAWHAVSDRGSAAAKDTRQAAVQTSLPAQLTDPTLLAGATPSPTPTATTPPTGATTAAAQAAQAQAAAPAHFGTQPPGAPLPSSSQCATWIQAHAIAENKRVNATANQTVGHRLPSNFLPASDDPRANTQVSVRVDGAFRGTTQQILRWAACKWGIDEDIVYAQAAKESWWRQNNLGDWGADPNGCAPGHGLGADGKPGQCPQSFGILQNRYPYEQGSWPGIANSTAGNADTAYAIWRACFEGFESWLNNVDRGRQYGAGDAWGCVGRWFSGRWHTSPSDQYVSAVQDYLNQRIWQQPNFQEP